MNQTQQVTPSSKPERVKSLRGRLILIFILLAVIPLVITQGITLIRLDMSSVSDVKANLQAQATLLSSTIKTWSDQRVKEIQTVATTPEVMALDTNQMAVTLARFAQIWGGYEGIFVMGPDGTILMNSDPSMVGKNLAERVYFQQAMTGQTVISDPLISKATGNVAVVFAVPVMVDGKVVGVAGGTAPITEISSLLSQVSVGASGEAYLLNQDGFFFTPSRFTDQLKQEGLIKDRTELELQIDTYASQQLSQDKSGEGTYQDYRGIPVIGVFKVVPGLNWHLVIEMDQSEALIGFRSHLFTGIALMALAAVLVIFIAVLVANSVINPVKNITAVAQALAKGDLSQKVTYHSQDEIGLLAEFVSPNGQLPGGHGPDRRPDRSWRLDDRRPAAVRQRPPWKFLCANGPFPRGQYWPGQAKRDGFARGGGAIKPGF